jgi:hypothetical protein
VRGRRRLISLVGRAPWVLGLMLSLTGCGAVQIAPEPALPRALVQPVPVEVGLLLTPEQRSFRHTETRAGVEWAVELGAGHQSLAREVFRSLFAGLREFSSLEEVRAAEPERVPVIMEPLIEQYSFATARETGGEYVAVTIRYRINVFNSAGQVHDVLSLTGYGTSFAAGLSSGPPIEQATQAAMRDAAARFLTQFSELPLTERLLSDKPLEALNEAESLAAAAAQIEAVPIRVSRRVDPTWTPAATTTR